NEPAKAEEAYAKAVSMDPKNLNQRQTLADFYATIGKTDKSIETLLALSKDDPANAGFKDRLANIYLSQKAYDKATALAEEMLKVDHINTEGLVLKGRILLAQNNNSQALTLLQDAVKHAPNSPSARYFLGLAHFQSGNRRAAEAEWTEAARNPGRFFQPVSALAQLKVDSGDPD